MENQTCPHKIVPDPVPAAPRETTIPTMAGQLAQSVFDDFDINFFN